MGTLKGAIKLIMTGTGLALIGVAVAVILLSTQLEELVRVRVEERIGAYYGAEARLDDIRLAPLQRGVELTGITVFAPDPFDRKPAIECGRLLLSADLATLFSPRPTLSSVAMENARVTVRVSQNGTNIGRLFANAAAYQEAREESQAVRRTLVVQDCRVSGGELKLTSLLPTIEIDDFRIKEITPEHPVPTWKTSSIFLRSLLTEALTAKGLLDPVLNTLKEEFGDLFSSSS